MPQHSDELITTLADSRLCVLVPFDVRSWTYGSSVVAEAPEVNESGFGLTRAEAVQDLRVAITELCLTLWNNRRCPGPDLRKVWEVLQGKASVHRQR